MIRCRLVTELKKLPDEVGAMEFPFVMELLEYWVEFPPEHIMLRRIAQYDPHPQPKWKSNWKEPRPSIHRALEIGDAAYVAAAQQEESEDRPKVRPPRTIGKRGPRSMTEEERVTMKDLNAGRSGARHLDCAPGHVQEAIARFKRGEHLDVPD